MTPYIVPIQDALDNPSVREVIVVGPGRSGKTTSFENYLLRRMIYGPPTDFLHYMGSDSEVSTYTTQQWPWLFETPEVIGKIGAGRSDNNLSKKVVWSRTLEVLPANNKTITQRQAAYIFGDELDVYSPRLCASFLQQTRIRGRVLGNRRKVGLCSHPDRGWGTGIANAWEQSSRGIFIMPCAECNGWASVHSTKFWPEIPQFNLTYQQDPLAASDERIAMAKASAAMVCPHCGALLTDEQRLAMIDDVKMLHKGQTLDVVEGVVGDIDQTETFGAWIHGLLLKTITLPELARDLETAKVKFDQTGKSDQLREVTAKVLGEVFEGAKAGRGSSSASLQKRAASERVLQVGEFPPNANFIVAAVDVGSGKFDVSFRAFDLESRSWWLDRFTIRQRLWADGVMRDIRTRERIEDWDVLYAQVIDRTFPIIGSSGLEMPVAVVTIDVGDGNVVWKGREFARRALVSGRYWGSPAQPWSRVRLIQGSSSAKAPELPVAPTKISKDEHGRIVSPIILEYTLGVHKLKELAVERLGVDDGGPGQCLFAEGIAGNHFDEYFNERLIDGKWERNGPNESLDLFAYEEAGRLMLRPDRADLKWSQGQMPPWARPVTISKGGDQDDGANVPTPPEPPKRNPMFERLQSLTQSDERDT